MFCFVFSKQNKETFQTFTGSIRGARTCLLAGTGGRSPTAMLLELGAKAAFLQIHSVPAGPREIGEMVHLVNDFV